MILSAIAAKLKSRSKDDFKGRHFEAGLTIAGVTDLSAAGTGNPAPDLTAALAGAPASGMIRGLERLVARGNRGFVSGRYEVDGMTLYVNNGTALWPGFALRLGRPSELTRITLRRAG